MKHPFVLPLLALPLLAGTLSARPPNIVVVLVDDIGYGDLACLNPQVGYETPNLDALAAAGVVFRQAHSTAAVCAPSRYAMLTGNYVFRGLEPGGVWTHCTPSQIRPGQMTLAGLLKRSGYRSAFLGKLHLGGQFHRRDGSPEPARLLREADLSRPMFDGMVDHGFDYTLVLSSGIQRAPYAFFENDRLARWEPGRRAFRHFDTDEEARRHFQFKPLGSIKTEDQIDKSWNDNYHMDNFAIAQVGPILAFKSLQFIEQHVAEHPDRPFFLYLSSQAARHPWQPPVDLSPDDPDRYDRPGRYPVRGKTPTLRGDMVYESDATTGVLIERLKKLGVYDNTLVIYASDNGAGHFMASGPQWEEDHRYFNFKWGGFGGNRIDRQDDREGRVVNPQGVAEDGRPLKGQKGDAYDGGHRVPFMVGGGKASGLSDAARGRSSQRMVSLHDVFATLCDMVGVQRPAGQALDSVSFAGFLKTGDEAAGPRRTRLMAEVARVPVAFEQAWVRRMAKEKGWQMEIGPSGYVVGLKGRGAPPNQRVSGMMESSRQARALYAEEGGKRWKLVVTADKSRPCDAIEAWELYEMVADPVESDNLADHPEQQRRIKAMLAEYRELVGSDERYR